jgi:hypothetical protein
MCSGMICSPAKYFNAQQFNSIAHDTCSQNWSLGTVMSYSCQVKFVGKIKLVVLMILSSLAFGLDFLLGTVSCCFEVLSLFSDWKCAVCPWL